MTLKRIGFFCFQLNTQQCQHAHPLAILAICVICSKSLLPIVRRWTNLNAFKFRACQSAPGKCACSRAAGTERGNGQSARGKSACSAGTKRANGALTWSAEAEHDIERRNRARLAQTSDATSRQRAERRYHA